jgi:periplasmic divalent cation tolerance protein
MDNGHIVVFMTAPDAGKAAAIGRKAVEEGFAACCSIIPSVRSIYTWKGEVCDESEALCVFKTRAGLFEGLKERIKELHPYEVPEIIAFDIKAGLKEYLSWIDGSTAHQKSSEGGR